MGDTTNTAATAADATQQGQGEQTAQKQEQPGDTTAEEQKTELTAQQMQEELTKVRKEAAKYRTERNKLREEAESAAKADRTDTDRIAALEEALAAEKTAAARAQVAAKAGVPPEFIIGADAEEMADNAAQLSQFIDSQVEKKLQAKLAMHKVMPVVAGENAGGQPIEGGDWLRKMFQRK